MNTKGGERERRTQTKGRVKERPGAAAAPSVRFWRYLPGLKRPTGERRVGGYAKILQEQDLETRSQITPPSDSFQSSPAKPHSFSEQVLACFLLLIAQHFFFIRTKITGHVPTELRKSGLDNFICNTKPELKNKTKLYSQHHLGRALCRLLYKHCFTSSSKEQQTNKNHGVNAAFN